MSAGIKSVFCADDFTGASDTLAALERHGQRTRLYLRPPTPEQHPELADLDAMGVATSLRAQTRPEAVTHMSCFADDLAVVGATFYHLKICSTFDSSPDTGNIAATADVFADKIGASCIAVIGGQPSLGRYCLFGNLFARLDGETYRIDRHPVMRAHPTTPMDESDLRMHLKRQGWHKLALIPYTDYQGSGDELAKIIDRRLADGQSHLLFDVSKNDDLAIIGAALRRLCEKWKILCVGASSVVEALYPHSLAAQRSPSRDDTKPTFHGPVLAFSGSRSPVTSDQIERASRYTKVPITAAELQNDEYRSSLVNHCQTLLSNSLNVLVYLTEEGDQNIEGPAMAMQTAAFIHDTVNGANMGCLIVAGGDTSSAAVANLDIESISMVRDFDRGVPFVRAHGDNQLDGLLMVLKGGQMGSRNLFDAVARLRQPA